VGQSRNDDSWPIIQIPKRPDFGSLSSLLLPAPFCQALAPKGWRPCSFHLLYSWNASYKCGVWGMSQPNYTPQKEQLLTLRAVYLIFLVQIWHQVWMPRLDPPLFLILIFTLSHPYGIGLIAGLLRQIYGSQFFDFSRTDFFSGALPPLGPSGALPTVENSSRETQR